jgi:hypothetical protein
MKIVMLVVIFLCIGALFLISENNLVLKQHENITKFYSLYANWLNNIADNSIKLSGYIVKMDWLPKESK